MARLYPRRYSRPDRRCFFDREALVDDRVRIGWSELRGRVNRLAAGLMRAGIGKGECVLLQWPNWAEYLRRIMELPGLDQYDLSSLRKISARIKDIIIRGGEDVSHGHVERLLCEHEAVAGAAVVGVPDRELGERLCACIRLALGFAPDADAIKRFMENRGASKLLIPQRFVFLDSLPVTQAGKLDKNALREEMMERLRFENV